jgi:uncharacterized membrane-anchored protein
MSKEWMKGILGVTLALGVCGLAAADAQPAPPAPAEDQGPDVNWVQGPASGELGSVATVTVPEKYIFAGPDDTKKLMEAMHNPTSGTEMGLIAPMEGSWFIVFEYDDSGHVADDEKGDLDADAILKTLRESQKEGNKERAKRGWNTLEISGWMQPPHYDPETHNLEWGTRLKSSSGSGNVNYNSRLLGRTGVMSATFVGDEKEMNEAMAAYKTILKGHAFVSGQKYAEFRKGDKVAKYGLAALITGGAAAVALKSGLLAKFWKLIVLAVAGGAAGIRKLFGKLRNESTVSPEGGPTPT